MSKSRFTDPDLHTPAHDAIMCWLDANAVDVARAAVEEPFRKLQARAAEALGGIPADARFGSADNPELFNSLMRSEAPDVDVKTQWEAPQRFGGGTRFIDLLISGSFRAPVVDWDAPYEYPVRRADSLGATWCRSYAALQFDVACEVKPVIRSVGELIRQLRQYELPNRRGRWVAVVSPDDRFREIIERQGFLFIKAPQPDYGPQSGLF